MSQAPAPETPLEKLDGVDPALLDALRSRWITSVEQLVAQGATPEGRSSLAALLEIEEVRLDALLAQARAILDPGAVADLEKPHPDDKGMGALEPPS